jgi:hypothetical protein
VSAPVAARAESWRFGFLLATLLFLLVSLPLGEQFELASFLQIIAFWTVLLAGVLSVEKERWVWRVAIVLAVPAVLSDVQLLYPGEVGLAAASNAFNALFLLFVCGVLLRHILRREEVTTDLILGGVCIYLMLGILFSQIFRVIEILSPGSFLVHGSPLALGPGAGTPEGIHLIYYSFVTLTTLGYGEIVPMSSWARMLAIIEAMMGSLYIAILIASLVGIRIASGGRPSS